MSRYVKLLLALTVVFAVLTYVARLFMPIFSVISLYLFLVLLILSMKRWRYATAIYCASYVFLAMSLFEFYSAYEELLGTSNALVKTRTDGFFQPHPELGYSLKKERHRVSASARTPSGESIYEVTYTIDENGLRIMPEGKSKGPIFFFGDSFTFGEGVDDDETFPYLFSARSEYRAYNFGLLGYGPHQMLRTLELGIPRKLEPRHPTYAIYTALSQHRLRAAGYAKWDRDGPYYRVESDTAIHAGSIRQNTRFHDLVVKLFRQSYIASRLLKSHTVLLSEDEDIDRFLHIVKKSRDIIERDYGAKFIVLYYDVHPNEESDQAAMDYIWNRLNEWQIRTIRLSERLPQLRDDSYYIPIDLHPNATAHRAIAEMLLDEIK